MNSFQKRLGVEAQSDMTRPNRSMPCQIAVDVTEARRPGFSFASSFPCSLAVGRLCSREKGVTLLKRNRLLECRREIRGAREIADVGQWD